MNYNYAMKIVSLRALLLALLFAASCSPMVDSRGYVKQGELKDVIIVGKTSRQEVIDTFGSPSTTSSFGSEIWYYISNRKETKAFLKAKITDQNITRIEFDDSGMVSKVETYNYDQMNDIKSVARETPTEGHSLGFLEQTLGNIGRFNKPGASSDTAAPGRKPSSGSGY